MRLMITLITILCAACTQAPGQARLNNADELHRPLRAEDVTGDLSALHALRNLAVVKVKAQTTSLERLVEGEVADSRYIRRADGAWVFEAYGTFSHPTHMWSPTGNTQTAVVNQLTENQNGDEFSPVAPPAFNTLIGISTDNAVWTGGAGQVINQEYFNMMQFTMIGLVCLSACCGVAIPHKDLEPLYSWSSVEIARVRVHGSVLIDSYTNIQNPGDKLPEHSKDDFVHGIYESSIEVIEVLAGSGLPEGATVNTGRYHTSSHVSRHALVSVYPPFRPDEEVVLLLNHQPYFKEPWYWASSWWNYLWDGRAAVARPGTETYRRDLATFEALAGVLSAEVDEQWAMLEAYAMGTDRQLATWAIETLLREQRLVDLTSPNYKRASEILDQVMKSPGNLSSLAQHEILRHMLMRDESYEKWRQMAENMASADYSTAEAAETSLNELVSNIESVIRSERLKSLHIDATGVLAKALVNPTVPVSNRVERLQRLGQSVGREPSGFTRSALLDILVHVLRGTDEAELEVAAVETIRDALWPSHEAVAALRGISPEVASAEALAMIEEMLGGSRK